MTDHPEPKSSHSSSLLPNLKEVPESKSTRDSLRRCADELVASLEHRVTGRKELEMHARAILQRLELPERFLAWTMVTLGSTIWRDQVKSIPHSRRILLLPHCMRDSEKCKALYDESGLLCENCGACPLGDMRTKAKKLGYRVLIAEGSPYVLQLILSGEVDAVLGIGCLNSLEKSFEKILMADIPGLAVPLHSCGCVDTETDLDVAMHMIETPYVESSHDAQKNSRIHLLRTAHSMFTPEGLFRLIPPTREFDYRKDEGVMLEGLDPISATEALGYDFLLQGGKHFRPFITLAAYRALAGEQLPDSVKRVAMAIEIFHKSSLVHDDIEDDDAFRYGQPTLHHLHGVPMAINIGDYLLGLGYRVVAQQTQWLPSDAVADILAHLGIAHTKLSEGQGAELLWRDKADKRLSPLDALKIYALKTAPAFEVALYAGLRMAGPIGAFAPAVSKFSRHLGIAFQILNDLKDRDHDAANSRAQGVDLLGGRPTVLWALALDGLAPNSQQELLALADTSQGETDTADRLARMESLYRTAGVYEKARLLVDRHASKAREIAAAVDHEEFRRLLSYLLDTIIG